MALAGGSEFRSLRFMPNVEKERPFQVPGRVSVAGDRFRLQRDRWPWLHF